MPESAIPSDFSQKIKNLRLRLGLTQVALAEKLGVSFPSVNRWENGKATPSQVCWGLIQELSGESATGQGETLAEPDPPPYPSDATPPLLDFAADPGLVRVLAEGERLSFGHLANPTFATEVASIDPLPHQRLAVYDHMLPQSRLRFLLADDAGAGKTIMTGLYIREMFSRRLLKRVLIVPPAGLVGNWQRELSSLFGMHFEILSGNDARTRNPFLGLGSDRVIVSVDTLAGTRMFARLRDEDVEPYDLVVFDEAHKLSSNRGNDARVRNTERYELAEAIAGVHGVSSEWKLPWRAHHLLLLTATPHMGKAYPFYALWKLLEPEVLATQDAFDQFPPEQRKRYFLRRTKEEMVRLDGKPLYPKRMSDTLGYQLTQGEISEQKLYDDTTEYLRHIYNKAILLNQSAARLATSVFQRRLASSTYALLCSFERRLERLDQVIDDVRQGKITPEQLLTMQRRLSDADDVFESKAADEESAEDGREENEVKENRIIQGIIATSLADLVAEREEVERLRNLARRVYDSGQESKFEKLREIILSPKYAQEKLIVFTEHRDTLDFLTRRLGGMGYAGQVAQIHGGMHYLERQEQVERFRKGLDLGGARFMLCTDAAAEGINLQFCWIMINYDVPWNPARLEQRMGRIHRYLQKHDPVIILNLVAPATREGRVLLTLLNKLEAIRKQLRSDKVFDSIGRVFTDVSIKDYMERALTGDPEALSRELDGRLTPEQVKAIEETERQLYGTGGDVARELPKLRESVEQETYFRLLPGYIRKFVSSAAPLVGIEMDGDPGERFSLKPSRKGAVDPLLQALESYPARQRTMLSVSRPENLDACVWMHPGEPVFERFRELVRTRLGKDALRGAVFMDPMVQKPYLFHIARLTVLRQADPHFSELNQEEVAECRLVGLKQTDAGEVALCPVENLLLLSDGHGGLPSEAQRLALSAESLREQAKAYLIERVARTMALERRGALLKSLEERETFLKRGYDFQEAELATERSTHAQKARQGDKAALQRLEEVKNRQQSLSSRREQALAVLRREPELLVPGKVEFIAHALAVPSSDPEARQRQDLGVELMAMELARAFEESAGAKVRLVHTPELARAANLPDFPGFDVLSLRPNGERRCIEVKGRVATGEVDISDNEWARACNLRQDYWLYVAYHCGTPTPQLVRVQDPFQKLLVRAYTRTQVVESVREVGGVRIGHSQVLEVGEV